MKLKILFGLILILCPVFLFGPLRADSLDPDIAVSLNFDDTPIADVLRMLADQNRINLVVSSTVTGDISIHLENVTLGAALDALLLPNGYNYYINNDIIIVKAVEQQVSGEMTARTYNLSHIDASVAASVLTPLLSANGSVIPLLAPSQNSNVSPPSSSSRLMVHDFPAVQTAVGDVLYQIDRPRRQVSVEVKIIETNLTRDEKLGINWPKSISASIDNAERLSGFSSGDDAVSGSDGDYAAFMPLESGDWQLGALNIHQVNIVLDYLQRRGNSKLLSNPRVTTMDNETAIIQIQKVIPIQTINRFSEGAVIQDIVTFQDEEVGISLKVTPRINDDSTITLRVNPVVEEIIGYTGPTDNQKPITSERSVNTSVTVHNNETVALGGLLKETQFETEEKVFLLGSIPILGHLFRNKSTETQMTDLLILITPRIMD